MQKKRLFFTIIYILAVLTFIIWLASDYYREYKLNITMSSLQIQVSKPNITEIASSLHGSQTSRESIQESSQTTEPTQPNTTVQAKFVDLFMQNQDLVGWIKIEGTVVDYPVMYTPFDGDYYLYRDFEKNKSVYGLPFVDPRSTIVPMSANVLIHGHHMKDGSMFAILEDYKRESFFKDHPLIKFDTVIEDGTYEVFAAFATTATGDEDTDFRYFEYVRANTEAEFNAYVEQSIAASLYDTGIVPTYGDQLLTLSTCSYHVGDGRMVVVARKITG